MNDNIFGCIMEHNRDLNCWVTISPYNGNSFDEFVNFYNQNNFMIGRNFFDPEWSNEIQIEEIFKRLLIYKFSPNDENLTIVRGPKKVLLVSKGKYVEVEEGGIFAFDKTKVEVDYEESEQFPCNTP